MFKIFLKQIVIIFILYFAIGIIGSTIIYQTYKLIHIGYDQLAILWQILAPLGLLIGGLYFIALYISTFIGSIIGVVMGTFSKPKIYTTLII